MSERKPSSLTPAQAADVINYYDRSENARYHTYGGKRKVPLALVALHTSFISRSILPSGESMLTSDEALGGLNYLRLEESQGGDLPTAQEESSSDPTPEEEAQIERLVDLWQYSYTDAFHAVMRNRY